MTGGGITVNDILSLFNVFVGVMLTLAILLFIGGVIVWYALLGLVIRDIGIRLMEWGVVVLFVLTVLLAVIQFFVGNPAATAATVAVVVALLIGFAVVQIIKDQGNGEKKEH